MKEYKQLRAEVLACQGVLQVTMGELRTYEQAGKLGIHVLAGIRHNLAVHELETFESELPGDQRATVWLLSPHTDLGSLLLEIKRDLGRAA